MVQGQAVNQKNERVVCPREDPVSHWGMAHILIARDGQPCRRADYPPERPTSAGRRVAVCSKSSLIGAE